MVDFSSPEFIIFALTYTIFIVYVVRHFWRDLGKYMAEGMSKKEARAAVHKDYRKGLLDPQHKMFVPGVYLLCVFIYWVVRGVVQ